VAAPPFQAPPSDLVGQTVSHYRVLARIGGGAMGVVYRAEDTRLGHPVALKFLTAELAQDRQALARFQKPLPPAPSWNHPNICIVHDIDEHAGQGFHLRFGPIGEVGQGALHGGEWRAGSCDWKKFRYTLDQYRQTSAYVN
jgi:serine/threonine protein kinase